MASCGCDWVLFLLDHPFPAEFVTSQYQSNPSRTPPWYLAYRIFMFIFVLANYIAYIITLDYDQAFFFIYLTHWGLTLILLFEFFDMILISIEFAQQRKYDSRERVRFLHRLCWLLSNMRSAGSLFITVFYWIVLYSPEDGDSFTWWNFFVHAANSIICYIDLFITARPWRWQHFYQVGIFGIVYSLFSVIYHVNDGVNYNNEKFIYEVLDWSKPGTAIAASLGSIIGTMLIHFLNFGLYKLRVYLASLCRDDNKVAPQEHRVSVFSIE